MSEDRRRRRENREREEAAEHEERQRGLRQRAITAAQETRIWFANIPHITGTDPSSRYYNNLGPLVPLPRRMYKLRTMVMDGNPFIVAKQVQEYINERNDFKPHPHGRAGERAPPIWFHPVTATTAGTQRVLILNSCHERLPGGDWEGGVVGIGVEESLARRSNLVQTLETLQPGYDNDGQRIYPMQQIQGIYSPNVIVFRDGHENNYEMWRPEDWCCYSMVSVPPIRRPRVDNFRLQYNFPVERDLQQARMRLVLRIAALNGHVHLVLGGFGSCGFGTSDCSEPSYGAFKNPVGEVVRMWNELLFQEPEFIGRFETAVFAIQASSPGWNPFNERFA